MLGITRKCLILYETKKKLKNKRKTFKYFIHFHDFSSRSKFSSCPEILVMQRRTMLRG